jgi:hypothetical protein
LNGEAPGFGALTRRTASAKDGNDKKTTKQVTMDHREGLQVRSPTLNHQLRGR